MGVATREYQVWLWASVNEINREINNFIKGYPDEPDSTVFQKLMSDVGCIPYRYLIETVFPLNIPNGVTCPIYTVHLKVSESMG